MSVNDSVNRIVTGSGVILAGTFIGMLLDIITKKVLTAHLSPADFGTYSLALTVISITGAFATLGLNEGVPRYIAFFRGRHEEHKVHELIISAMIMGLIAGLIAILVSPSLFQSLAGDSFDSDGHILSVVKILIFAVPFTILLNLAVAIYRGFDRTNVNMYFYNIIRPVSLLGFALCSVFVGASLKGVVFADLLSMIFTFGIMSLYFIKKPPFKQEWKIKFSEPTKQLIRYSLPLLITATILNLMSWIDTIMLGYFKPSEVVGVYNAVYPLVGFLSLVITSMGFVYVPVTSKLWGQNNIAPLGSIYEVMTKWCFLLTFPLFALIFVYPEYFITRLYGAEYVSGATALRILAMGFITNSYFGFNYHTLLASGDSDFLMKCSVASAGINAVINFTLIPEYGMIGAATGTAVSYASIEVLMTLRAWRKQNMHPFTSMYRKLTCIVVLMVGAMLAIKSVHLLTGAAWEYAVFIVGYFTIIHRANVLDSTEIQMLGEIRKALRLNIRLHIPEAIKTLAAVI
ncbi:MAG: flippase [Methanosarcina thermophila]|jgi:O-antigen/teichoic acid export membrane protein|uniref:Heteropolysaccharide repeat unit export protein n=3 Tax=Methanosarcina thermophila TaxID=2210 RepID=A0A1I7AD93_METTE|nr:flippase [Methanosarcina thermophila]ALK06202.1 MAG: polysaccharide biosynthesis protein [Methanosarcina sp. 795]AKB12215.1 Heteropolysaccharide repeat unit export protein [Methanosarcina thermophila TM-1]AKB14582.1 Heteropolysaccharide repeat unit export protein [Methanosarcina thermophila CHTI-55]NLU57307.1 flippase [Methanosarcina thermophila]SFT72864.1 Membrane protein involved in the export of O-antigen and teichoic acid [Methanosarcina thermophila]